MYVIARWLRLALALVALVAFSGCDDSEPPLTNPSLEDLEDGWNIIEPGGDTICSRGTPFRYAVRKGTVNRVVVDYMGGGACWDSLTCSVAGAIFNEDTEHLDNLATGDLEGIYDVDDPENPFKDWYHVFIPYCTGDIHWGNATVTYGSGDSAFEINHRGAVNGQAVLDWMTEHFDAPDQMFITGCSAGAYGSLGWAPRLMEAFPSTPVAQFGDSGVGVITNNFFMDSFPSWNAVDFVPYWVSGLDPAMVDIYALNMSDLYGLVANHYDTTVFSQYNTAYDDNQSFYFEAMGGGTVFDWSTQMYSMIDEAESQAPNFAAYIAGGERHCIVHFPEFYTVETDGVRLVDWVNDLVAGNNPGSVRCQGDAECMPPAP